jgi:hypothetical protein
MDFTFTGIDIHMDEAHMTNQWIDQGKLTASDGSERDLFGSAIPISADIIVVIASGGDSKQGSVYVFYHDTLSRIYFPLIAR